MDILTYVITIANLAVGIVVGLVVPVVRNADDYILETESIIKEEFRRAYTEFSNTVSRGALSGIIVENESLKLSVERLKKLHYSACIELPKIKLVETILKSIPIYSIALILLTFASALSGILFFEENNFTKILLSIVIPAVFFILEWLLLILALKFERFLKRLKNRYKDLEY